MTEIVVGSKVRINLPKEPDLHGKVGVVEEIDECDEMPYSVHIPGEDHRPDAPGGCGLCDIPTFRLSELVAVNESKEVRPSS